MKNAIRPSIIKDWKAFPEGREKYQLYLASREWAIKKEAVRKRSGGTCERCKHNDASQVHHQTYERKYREAMEDLVHLCAPCHEFLSGKRSVDPVSEIPIRLFGREIRKVYLAGKITNDTWRDQIAPGWSDSRNGFADDAVGGQHHGEDQGFQWNIVGDAIKIPDGRTLDMTGPYWRAGLFSGHDLMGVTTGGYHEYGELVSESPVPWHGEGSSCKLFSTNSSRLYQEICKAVSCCDLLFAWINSFDCFGTLHEIVLASHQNKKIVIATPKGFDRKEIWMTSLLADCVIGSDSPGTAWAELWSADEGTMMYYRDHAAFNNLLAIKDFDQAEDI